MRTGIGRIRIVLASTEHEFLSLDIFSGNDRALLASRNPAMKVPCLEDGSEIILDSRIIYNYLAEKYSYERLSWEAENQLTLIDAVNDSLVQLLLLKRSDFDIEKEKLYFNLQRERIESVFSILAKQINEGKFAGWHYPEICLYSLVDWVLFRGLHNMQDYPELLRFHEKHQNKIEVTATDPRT